MLLIFLFGYFTLTVYAPWLALSLTAIGLLILLLALVCNGGMWLLEQGAKALPAGWLFDGSARPPLAPKPLKTDDGPSPSSYHTSGGWHEAYKAWQAGKPIPFNAHNVSWRYGDDTY